MTISQARIRCAFLRERTISPVSSSMPSSRTSTLVAGLGRRLVLPLVERDEALGLVADVDDDLVADDLDDLARDDPADLEALALAEEVVEVVVAVLAHDQGRELVFADIKFTEQVTIYHVRFRFNPAARPARATAHRLSLRERIRSTRSGPRSIARRDPSPELLQRINVSETRKPPLHARGGIFQSSIIGATPPNTTRDRAVRATTNRMKTRICAERTAPLAGAASAASIGDGWRRNSEGPLVGLTDATMPCSLRATPQRSAKVRRSARRHASIVARRESEHADPSPGLSGRLDGRCSAPIGLRHHVEGEAAARRPPRAFARATPPAGPCRISASPRTSSRMPSSRPMEDLKSRSPVAARTARPPSRGTDAR